MSTNPGSVIGTNAAYGGRTGAKAFNDTLALLYGFGILSGWVCSPLAEMTLQLGGDGVHRDVAVAQNANGDRTTVDNRSEMPIEVEIEEAPESGTRIDAIVAYVNDPPISTGTYVDNPDACGLIVVSGVASENPVKPDDGAIRTAITYDGESGETAFYVVLAYVTVAAGVTNLTADDIEAGQKVGLKDVDKVLDINSDNSIANKAVTAAINGVKSDLEDFKDDLDYYEGETIVFSIEPEQWSINEAIEPFVYTASITAVHTITNNTIVELINDNAISFATYGFAIGQVSGQNITIYALKLPTSTVSLTINFKEVSS